MFSENEDYIPYIPRKRGKTTMPRGVLEDPSQLMAPHLRIINLTPTRCSRKAKRIQLATLSKRSCHSLVTPGQHGNIIMLQNWNLS